MDLESPIHKRNLSGEFEENPNKFFKTEPVSVDSASSGYRNFNYRRYRRRFRFRYRNYRMGSYRRSYASLYGGMKRYARNKKYLSAGRRYLRMRRSHPGMALQFIPRTEQTLAAFGPSYRRASAGQQAARKAANYYGRGAYWGAQLGGMAGDAIGSRIGVSGLGRFGRLFGDRASNWAQKRFMGGGAYATDDTPVENDLVNSTGHPRAMISAGDETGDISISHTEYITDILSTGSSFQTLVFNAINPGLSTLFPWLSQIAAFFDEYEFNQLIFLYETVVSAGNSSSSGNVIMATQYNPLNPAFATMQNMENYDYSVSFPVDRNGVHGVECDPGKTAMGGALYVRTSAVPSGQDAKTYDTGLFQLSAIGTPTGTFSCGKLRVKYNVTLRKSKIQIPGFNNLGCTWSSTITLASGVGFNNLGTFFGLNGVGTFKVVNLPSPALSLFDVLGTQGFSLTSSPSGTNTCVSTLSFPVSATQGNYKVSFYWTKPSSAIDTGNILNVSAVYNNCSLVANSTLSTSSTGTTTTTASYSIIVALAAPGNSIASIVWTVTSNLWVAGSITCVGEVTGVNVGILT